MSAVSGGSDTTEPLPTCGACNITYNTAVCPRCGSSPPVMRVMQTLNDPDAGVSYWMWCPGCDDAVRITNGWDWNGDLERPTFTPSILTEGGPHGIRCHSFLTDGVWNYLGDCTHAMAGQSMPMVALPEWLVTS